MEAVKPIFQDAHIFDGETGLEDIFADMFEVRCGKCNQLFGLSTGEMTDTSYFENNYHFCNKCGTPVSWDKDVKSE